MVNVSYSISGLMLSSFHGRWFSNRPILLNLDRVCQALLNGSLIKWMSTTHLEKTYWTFMAHLSDRINRSSWIGGENLLIQGRLDCRTDRMQTKFHSLGDLWTRLFFCGGSSFRNLTKIMAID